MRTAMFVAGLVTLMISFKVDAKNCKKGCACGNSCIPCSRTCHTGPALGSAPKIKKAPKYWGQTTTKQLYTMGCPGFDKLDKEHSISFESLATALSTRYEWAPGCEPAK